MEAGVTLEVKPCKAVPIIISTWYHRHITYTTSLDSWTAHTFCSCRLREINLHNLRGASHQLASFFQKIGLDFFLSQNHNLQHIKRQRWSSLTWLLSTSCCHIVHKMDISCPQKYARLNCPLTNARHSPNWHPLTYARHNCPLTYAKSYQWHLLTSARCLL